VDKEVDIVAVCLPSGLHSGAVIEAAKHSKHVICEKPIDVDIQRAAAMVDVCREHGVRCGVIMQHRFDKPVLLLKKAIGEGRLGKLLWGASRTVWYRDDAYFANPWRGTWEYDGGGALMNQSIHYIDLLLHIFGDVHSVSAKCRKLLHSQIEAEDIGVANLEFKNGCIGTIEGTTAAYPGLYAELCVFGENGSVIIRNDELLSYYFKDEKSDDFEDALNPQKANILHIGADIPDDSHRKQYEDFADSVISGREPLVTGNDALKSLNVIKKVYEASQLKQEVYL